MTLAVGLSDTTESCILNLEAPERNGGNLNVKLVIGIVSMLEVFPVFFPFLTRFLAIMLFLCGLCVYCSGLIENMSYVRARNRPPVQIDMRICGSSTPAMGQKCANCVVGLEIRIG
jgi:hypothetical protein